MTPPVAACAACRRRAWLLARLGGHLERVLGSARTIPEVLSLADGELIAALAGSQRAAIEAEWRAFDAEAAGRACAVALLTAVCRHDDRFPRRLTEARDAPSILHVRGDVDGFVAMASGQPVAVVGARRASPYGLEVARALGRGLAGAGVPVVSGMALGVDAAAHAGALEAGGPTIAVLAGGADRPYPPSKRALHARIAAEGAVVSELPPGAAPRRWGFPARNRIIAGLAVATVVVEAGERSGALITAEMARHLGREVGAVPGRVTARLATGTNALLYDGAQPIRDARDVLDLVFGAGGGPPDGPAAPPSSREKPRADALPPPLARLLGAVSDGRDTLAALVEAGFATEEAVTGLADLELRGWLRRGPGGRYVAVAGGEGAPVP